MSHLFLTNVLSSCICNLQ